MANRRAGAKTGANLGRKKADLSLPPAVSPENTRRKPKTVTPVRPKPVTPTPSNRPKSATPKTPTMSKPVQTVTPVRPKTVTPTPSNRPTTPSNRPTTPERPPTVVDEREYTKLRNASRIKAAMRDNPIPKIGNDLVKMNKGGKIRGYGMARGGKVCKMR